MAAKTVSPVVDSSCTCGVLGGALGVVANPRRQIGVETFAGCEVNTHVVLSGGVRHRTSSQHYLTVLDDAGLGANKPWQDLVACL